MNTIINYPALPGIQIPTWLSSPKIKWVLACVVVSLAFYFSGPLLRILDPAAAVIDIGVMGFPILSGLCLLGFLGISIWLTDMLWPSFRAFRKFHFEHHFKSLEPWQKIFFYMAAFFLLLYAFVSCLAAVM